MSIACGNKAESESKGGPATLKNLPLTFDLPAGWQITRDKVNSSGKPYAAIGFGKSDQLRINKDEIVFDNAVAFEKAWLKRKRNIKITKRETLENGFGFTFVESRPKREPKTMIHYHIKVGGATYEMESSSIYYDEKHLGTALSIIKSVKAKK